MKSYKHTFNMLEPGLKMVRIILILIAAGLISLLFSFRTLSHLCFIISALIAVVLILLIGIEHHQICKKYKEALREQDKDR